MRCCTRARGCVSGFTVTITGRGSAHVLAPPPSIPLRAAIFRKSLPIVRCAFSAVSILRKTACHNRPPLLQRATVTLPQRLLHAACRSHSVVVNINYHSATPVPAFSSCAVNTVSGSIVLLHLDRSPAAPTVLLVFASRAAAAAAEENTPRGSQGVCVLQDGLWLCSGCCNFA